MNILLKVAVGTAVAAVGSVAALFVGGGMGYTKACKEHGLTLEEADRLINVAQSLGYAPNEVSKEKVAKRLAS